MDPQVIAPTCDTEGKTRHQCADCSYSYETNILPPSGHTLTQVVKAPTCTDEGYTEYTCACGYSYRGAHVPPKGHQYNTATVAATCTEPGMVIHVCPCGESFHSDFKAPLGHRYQSATVPPTCTVAGFTVYTCSCGVSYQGEETPPTGHHYTVAVTEATCTDAGYTDYTCACGDAYRGDLVSPKGHHPVSTVTYPTLASMGYTTHTCACGFSYTGNFTSYAEILPNAYAGGNQVLAKGIDVSRYNHPAAADGSYLPLDWAAIRNAGVDYVILKAGSTLRSGGALGGLEPTFLADYAGAKAAGLDVGVYFYTYAVTAESARTDAELLLTWLEGKQFEYPIYLDLEDDSLRSLTSAQLTDLCIAFCSTLQAEGYYAGIYTNQDWLTNELDEVAMFQLFELWYARYPGTASPTWNTAVYGEHLGMWQYTDNGSFVFLSGIEFDFNYAYKNFPALMLQHGFNGYEATAV
ncbi:MAG: hypothetical protein IJY42_05465 [Clostridia bacterium]|nr:hypothetical protein [Clostridia bacterium]